jgi:NAD(P) transhydrogenase subunit alpha
MRVPTHGVGWRQAANITEKPMTRRIRFGLATALAACLISCLMPTSAIAQGAVPAGAETAEGQSVAPAPTAADPSTGHVPAPGFYVLLLTVFVLAMFEGTDVIKQVPPLLHTPLMSGSNAVSGITIVGAIICSGTVPWLSTALGFLAVVFATVNVVGGFLVTHRMLGMFQTKP